MQSKKSVKERKTRTPGGVLRQIKEISERKKTLGLQAGLETNSRFVTSGSFAHACRAGEAASEGLTEALLGFGFETDRLKTGTPARVDKRTIDFTHLEAQPGDEQVKWFSFDEEVCPASDRH